MATEGIDERLHWPWTGARVTIYGGVRVWSESVRGERAWRDGALWARGRPHKMQCGLSRGMRIARAPALPQRGWEHPALPSRRTH